MSCEKSNECVKKFLKDISAKSAGKQIILGTSAGWLSIFYLFRKKKLFTLFNDNVMFILGLLVLPL